MKAKMKILNTQNSRVNQQSELMKQISDIQNEKAQKMTQLMFSQMNNSTKNSQKLLDYI